MKTIAVGVLLLASSIVSFGRDQPALTPKHIEAPADVSVAEVARVRGKVVVQVTIDGDGRVTDAKAVPNQEGSKIPLLEHNSILNVQKWTFEKPPSSPYTETITYDYEFDESLRSGETRVTFDLPNRVNISTHMPIRDSGY